MSLIVYRVPDKTNSRQRGRPPIDEIQRLRILTWYFLVKSKGGWSDYKLDITFGLPGAKDAKEHAARPRIFELIRKRGVIPQRGENAKRGFDLIDEVENHPEFNGTKSIYESPFWELISQTSPTLHGTNKFVNKLLSLYGLSRIEVEFDALLTNAINDIEIDHSNLLNYLNLPAIERYDQRLSDALNLLPSDLDKLTLTGALFREAYLGMALKEANILKERLLDQIDRFFRDGWAKPLKGRLRETIIKRMIYWSFDPDEELDGWSDSVVQMCESYIVSKEYKDLRMDPNWHSFCLGERGKH